MLAANQLSEDGKIIRKVSELLGDIIGNAESCVRENQAPADFLRSPDEGSERDVQLAIGWVIYGKVYIDNDGVVVTSFLFN